MSGIKEYARDKTRDGIDNKLLAECNHHTEKHHIETTHYKVSPDQTYPVAMQRTMAMERKNISSEINTKPTSAKEMVVSRSVSFSAAVNFA